MKQKVSVRKRRKKPTFQPDIIVTSISQAIYRDLHSFTQEYEGPQTALYYAADVQKTKLLKKFSSSQVDKDHLEDLTFNKFLEVNLHMEEYRNIKFPDSTVRMSSKLCNRDKILIRAKALMHSVLDYFDEDEFFRACKHSGGATIGVSFIDTSIERKFKFPMSTTRGAKPVFDRYLNFDSSLKFAINNYNSSTPEGDWYSIVDGSRATTVNKDNTIRRMIAIEPTVNMFLQQGMMEMMYKRMKRVGLNVSNLPTVHKRLAKESSLTRRNATIDFSSASDCVSIELLRWLIPPKWFRLFLQIRSPAMTLKGQLIELNMCSTMGNAVTFPLETLVFWTMAHAVRLTATPRCNTTLVEYEDRYKCSVFGDDCIVPTEIASDFMDAMTDVGFIVNKEKSFYGTEPFRESCGGDYLTGFNVRPHSIKAPTSSRLSALEPWLYIQLNGLLSKYRSYFGSLSYIYEKEFFRIIAKTFREHRMKMRVVPDYFPDDSGFKISDDIARFKLCYDVDFHPVKVAENSMGLSFTYTKFCYRTKASVDDTIRYYTWLKKSGISKRPRPLFTDHRRVGGYVVAKSLSSSWTISSR